LICIYNIHNIIIFIINKFVLSYKLKARNKIVLVFCKIRMLLE